MFLVGMAFFSAGCLNLSDPEGSHEQHVDAVGQIRPGQTLGQSFVSPRPRLTGITLWLSVASQPADQDAQLIVELFSAPGEVQPLVLVPFDLKSISTAPQLTVKLPVQSQQANQAYYLSLRTTGGVIQVFGRNADTYPAGQAYLNDSPIEADLAFRLDYDYDLNAGVSDFLLFLRSSWLALPLWMLLFGPGLAFINLVGLAARFERESRYGLALGLSLAFFPVLMAWTTFFGIAWRPPGLLGLCLSVVGLLAWFWVWNSRRRPVPNPEAPLPQEGLTSQDNQLSNSTDASLLFLCILIIALAVRLIMVRDLSAPPWVDSVHHALITRLIEDHGGYPPTYQPYLDLTTANYHSGYHSLMVAFHWLSGLELYEAMLLFGQVLNALSIIAVYLFTISLTGKRRAGIAAGLVAGLFTPMPAYYTSWGRYTQLAGLLILPAALALTRMAWVPAPGSLLNVLRERWKLFLVAALAWGGLALTHYRVAAFMACWFFVEMIVSILINPRTASNLRAVGFKLFALGIIAVLALISTAPWWPATLSTLLLPKVTAWSGTGIPWFNDFSWGYLTSAMGRYALGGAALGLLLSLICRQWNLGLGVPLWVVSLFFLANLGALHLHGSGFVNNTSVEISLFMPIATLAGYFLDQLTNLTDRILPAKLHSPYKIALALATLGIGIYAGRQLIPILNPVTFLFRRGDAAAMQWIRQNIPAEETILVNPFSWGYGLYAGNDGGYWIAPLTGRKTIPPPVLYGLDDSQNNIRQTNQFIHQVIEKGSDPAALASLMQPQGIRFVYLGARGGVISPAALHGSPLFKLLYKEEGVYLFQVGSVLTSTHP